MFGWGRTGWTAAAALSFAGAAIGVAVYATAPMNPLLNGSAEAASQGVAVAEQLRTTTTPAQPATSASDGDTWDAENPTLTDIPAYGAVYGALYVPSLGDDYIRAIEVGTGDDVLDRNVAAVYNGSERAGEVGNLVLAGHREGVLNDLRLLEEGDTLLVRTVDGFYRYTMTAEHIIKPTQVEVLRDVPLTDEVATTATLTLITCYPDWGNTERRIIVAELTDWFPAEMAGTNGLPV